MVVQRGDVAAGDGRTARRDRNRVAVLDAMVELFSEALEPTPEEVARRSGISPRSVYRYFEDRDALVREAIDRQLDLVRPLYTIHAIGQGSLDERVDRLVESRLSLYEAVADTARAARHFARSNALIEARVRLTQSALREQVALQFESEFAAMSTRSRRSRLAAADALTQFESLDYLRVTQELGRNIVRTILRDALTDLLGDENAD